MLQPLDTPARSDVLRPLLRLVWPVMLEQLLTMLMGFSDKWLTGHFLPGDKYLAAMTLVAYLLGFVPGMFAAVSVSATAMIARFIGAGDVHLAQRVANQALVLGAIIVVLTLALAALFGGSLVAVMGLGGETAQLALQYLTIALIAVPAIMVAQVGIAVLRGAGDMITGMVAMTCQNTVNILVALALVSGWHGLPKLGWSGLAYGAVAGYFTTATIVLAQLARGRFGLKLQWRLMRPDFGLIRRQLRIGIPSAMDILSITGCQFWFLSIVNRLGDLAAAAHGVAITIESIAYMPGIAFEVASTTIVGQSLGARDERRAVRTVRTAAIWCMSLMSLIAAWYYFQAHWLAEAFLGPGHPEVADQAAILVRIVAFAQPALALLLIMVGSLRGAGDTRVTMVVSFIGLLLVRIPLAHYLAWQTIDLHLPGFDLTIAGCGLGVRGAWYAMVTDLTVRGLLVTIRFWQGGWKRVQV